MMRHLVKQFTGCAAALVLCITTVGCAQAIAPLQSAQASQKQSSPRPNVLIILADDLGWSDLGCYGSEIKTPNLDAIARGGLRFTQFYNSARCSPSRASLLTGLHPHQVGVPVLDSPLNDKCVTLPEVLGPVGYRTYMVGKWHLTDRSTPVMRGFDEFYGMLGGFNTYWEESPYNTRLPAGHPARSYKPGSYYSTNAYGDYALDFMKDGKTSGKPWFMYLAFNAPHFPLHAPEEAIRKYETLYRTKGWDTIRADRLARQKKLGLVSDGITLPPRDIVPANFINRKTGWADKQIPSWNSLPMDRRADLARRMAVYAASVDIMDQNIGRITDHLKKTGEWNNTLIFFLSDNGGCAEWDPYGFDALDSPNNILHKGENLKKVGGPDSYISYGSGWANVSNTPLRLFKHYAEEGGIRTPMIAHWPEGLKTKGGAFSAQLGYVTDFMPTLVELCGASYPAERNGRSIQPVEGTSLASSFRGDKVKPRTLFIEHEGNRMMREGDWKLVARSGSPWELYDLSKDPTEMVNLAANRPELKKKMRTAWSDWAQRTSVIAQTRSSPQIANRPLTIRCDVVPEADGSTGVIVAQGGNQAGYALHLKDGKPIFSVRRAGQLYSVAASKQVMGRFSLEARLAKNGALTLLVNGTVAAQGTAGGLIPVQPKDEQSIGEDTLSAVGDYSSPHPFRGKVENVRVETDTTEISANH